MAMWGVLLLKSSESKGRDCGEVTITCGDGCFFDPKLVSQLPVLPAAKVPSFLKLRACSPNMIWDLISLLPRQQSLFWGTTLIHGQWVYSPEDRKKV